MNDNKILNRSQCCNLFIIYGLMFQCYDLFRQKVSPIPFGEGWEWAGFGV